MGCIDLHVHSLKSDGSLSPAELVAHAAGKNICAIALTDHDTIDGLDEALNAAKGLDIEIIPGIELSTEYENRDIHILGLYIDYHSPSFCKYLEKFCNSRTLRNKKMCEKLAEAGVDITYELLCEMFPDSVLTRSHYAEYLLLTGHVKSRKEAFERYVGDHASCFVPREKVTPMQAVSLILTAGGIPVLAHPMLYRMSSARLDTLVSKLTEAGLMGIEAIYCSHTAAEEREVRALAAKYNLLISGGSDFHGNAKPDIDLACGYGSLYIDESILEKIKKARLKAFFTDLDGTLLNDEKNISPILKQTLDHMLERGHKLVFTSGRPLKSILEVKNLLGFDHVPGVYIISYNGAQIYDCGNDTFIKESRIPLEHVRHILDTAHAMGIHCHTYSDTHIISEQDTKELAYYKIHIHLPAIITEDATACLEKEPCKLIAIQLTDHEKLVSFQNALRPWSDQKIDTMFSNTKYLELIHTGVSKGNAVRYFCGHFEIPLKNSVAIGDAENDLSMLEAAGVGVAVQNATPAVKEIAQYVTKNDNNHDGAVEAIRKFLC